MRFYDTLKSTLERYLLRSPIYQLLTVAALIGLVSLGAGLAVSWAVPNPGTLSDSVWWGFLRLSDPGYLGDDEGLARRVISTIVTVLGYVLFMGSLVAIMTQWLNTSMRRLESGYTAIRRNNHILVLGWTSRAAIVVGDLLQSVRRVRYFLRTHGSRTLHVVVLADEVTPGMMQDIKSRASGHWDPNQITLRSGSALRAPDLARVDFLNASAILLPAGEFTAAGPANIDTHTIKALLSLSHHKSIVDRAELPFVVAEILDERKTDIARSAYSGPLEVLASDTVVSRLIAQNIRHRGLSQVYSELLTHRVGNEIFIRHHPSLAGRAVGKLFDSFPTALLLGVLKHEDGSFRPKLNCSHDYVLAPEDRLVLVACDYEETDPELTSRAARSAGPESPSLLVKSPPHQSKRRVLILGWSHKTPRLISELIQRGEEIEITIVSSVPKEQRQKTIHRYLGEISSNPIHLVEADYTNSRELSELSPQEFDNVVLLGSDWLPSGEESDARTIVGYLVLHKILEQHPTRPDVLVELLDAENVALLGDKPGDVLISPVILSHMLAQVVLRRELNSVFDRLFAVQGAEITFRGISDYSLPANNITFREVMFAVAARGETALGVVRTGPDGHRHVALNPSKDEPLEMNRVQELVVVADQV